MSGARVMVSCTPLDARHAKTLRARRAPRLTPTDRQLLTAALDAFMTGAPQASPPTLWLSNEEDSECDRAGSTPLDLLAFEVFGNQVVASLGSSRGSILVYLCLANARTGLVEVSRTLFSTAAGVDDRSAR